MRYYSFSAYGISFSHPETWQVFINPQKPFSAEAGFLKVDYLTGQQNRQASFSVMWETSDEDEGFAQRFFDRLTERYEANVKNKKRYTFYKKELLEHSGGIACYSRCQYIAKGGIHRMSRGGEALNLLQLAFYDRPSSRIIVGTVTAADEELQANSQGLQEILFSLTSS